jgi:hypothetical protein
MRIDSVVHFDQKVLNITDLSFSTTYNIGILLHKQRKLCPRNDIKVQVLIDNPYNLNIKTEHQNAGYM